MPSRGYGTGTVTPDPGVITEHGARRERIRAERTGRRGRAGLAKHGLEKPLTQEEVKEVEEAEAGLKKHHVQLFIRPAVRKPVRVKPISETFDVRTGERVEPVRREPGVPGEPELVPYVEPTAGEVIREARERYGPQPTPAQIKEVALEQPEGLVGKTEALQVEEYVSKIAPQETGKKFKGEAVIVARTKEGMVIEPMWKYKAKKKYAAAEGRVSKFISPATTYIFDPKHIEERIALAKKKEKGAPSKPLRVMAGIERRAFEYEAGRVELYRKQPIKSAALFGISIAGGAVVGKVLPLAGKAASVVKVTKMFPTATKVAKRTLQAGIIGAYAVPSGIDIFMAEPAMRWRVAGKKMAEFELMAAGAATGQWLVTPKIVKVKTRITPKTATEELVRFRKPREAYFKSITTVKAVQTPIYKTPLGKPYVGKPIVTKVIFKTPAVRPAKAVTVTKGETRTFTEFTAYTVPAEGKPFRVKGSAIGVVRTGLKTVPIKARGYFYTAKGERVPIQEALTYFGVRRAGMVKVAGRIGKRYFPMERTAQAEFFFPKKVVFGPGAPVTKYKIISLRRVGIGEQIISIPKKPPIRTEIGIFKPRGTGIIERRVALPGKAVVVPEREKIFPLFSQSFIQKATSTLIPSFVAKQPKIIAAPVGMRERPVVDLRVRPAKMKISKERVLPIQKDIEKEIEAQLKRTRTTPIEKPLLRRAVAPKQGVAEVTVPAEMLKQPVLTETLLRTQVPLIRQPTFLPPIQPTAKLPPLLPPFYSYKPKGRVERAFEVFVKRKGKFELVSPFPLARAKALELGIKKTDITAAATFQLRPRGVVQKPYQPLGRPERKLKKRYYEKSPFGFKPGKPETFIEKPRYRISTFGELREITFKGLMAKRKKRRGFF